MIFIWGVRWSAWVWPGQKTDGPHKKSLEIPKESILSNANDLSSLRINILQNFNCYLNEMTIKQTRPNA
jgi:hypothetical protein